MVAPSTTAKKMATPSFLWAMPYTDHTPKKANTARHCSLHPHLVWLLGGHHRDEKGHHGEPEYCRNWMMHAYLLTYLRRYLRACGGFL
jgi:hypothetical protein